MTSIPSPDAFAPAPGTLSVMLDRSGEAAQMLKMLANEKRLMVLCHLAHLSEANVGTLADAVGLSQSALSQHLAKMRDDGLVASRREGHNIYYSISCQNTRSVIGMLHAIYCPAE